jgi:orotate phosphoribosyltransferase
LRPFVTELVNRIKAHGVDSVCGPLNGGAFLAELVAVELGVEFAFTERTISERAGLFPVDYRVPLPLRAGLRGKRVAIIDDAISLGSAVRATLAEVEACQGTPVVIGALLVLGGAAPTLAAAKGLPLERLGELPLQSWLPSECPRCASGIPVADP